MNRLTSMRSISMMNIIKYIDCESEMIVCSKKRGIFMEFNYTPKYPVQTLQKAIEILMYIKENGSSDGLTIAELSEKLDMGKSVVHRILDTLYAYRFVEKTDKNGAYRLGWGIYEIAQTIPLHHSLNEDVYRKIMEKLCNEFQETVNLGIYNNGEVVIICKVEPDRRVRSNIEVGEREPLYATALGKQFLSEFTKDKIREYFETVQLKKLTENTIVDLDKMSEELKKVRMNGVSIDNQEYSEDLICTAAPIYNYENKIVAALSISVPESRYTEKKSKEIVNSLKEAAMEISEFLGY